MRKRLSTRVYQFIILNSAFIIFFSSCSVSKQIARSAKADVLDAKALQTAHIGISIFDPATNNYLYNYQGDKYFVPASNTKIPTCYAAMKYLGDSLVGLRYEFEKMGKVTHLYPSGDPTFLHKDFKNQRVFNFLKVVDTSIISFCPLQLEAKRFGNGWSWNDYNEPYMTERAAFPVFGNVFSIKYDQNDSLVIFPDYGANNGIIGIYSGDDFSNRFFERKRNQLPQKFQIKRSEKMNMFEYVKSNSKFESQDIPISDVDYFAGQYLHYLLKGYVSVFDCLTDDRYSLAKQNRLHKIHSQPTDSVLKPMMHRSDNFFAEQSLLMVSNEMLGVMNDEKIIDTLLKTDFKDLPQKPRWADGSGLSRYNLFTPQGFVAILNKMKNEFGMERLKVILPTGGEGTISNYYKADSGYIYAKTGTLSGVVAFSGFLYTKKGKLLIFSTLVNNHQASSTDVRRAVEKFLQGIRNNF